MEGALTNQHVGFSFPEYIQEYIHLVKSGLCGYLQRTEVKKNSKAVADAGESCLTTEKGLYSSLSLSDNAYSDLPMPTFTLPMAPGEPQCLWNNW